MIFRGKFVTTKELELLRSIEPGTTVFKRHFSLVQLQELVRFRNPSSAGAQFPNRITYLRSILKEIVLIYTCAKGQDRGGKE